MGPTVPTSRVPCGRPKKRKRVIGILRSRRGRRCITSVRWQKEPRESVRSRGREQTHFTDRSVLPQGPGVLGRAEGGNEEERPFSEIRRALHDAVRLLALHRWAFFVPFCLVCCGAFVASLYYPRTYTAMTGFEVRN